MKGKDDDIVGSLQARGRAAAVGGPAPGSSDAIVVPIWPCAGEVLCPAGADLCVHELPAGVDL